jgi:hypothetical protein
MKGFYAFSAGVKVGKANRKGRKEVPQSTPSRKTHRCSFAIFASFAVKLFSPE